MKIQIIGVGEIGQAVFEDMYELFPSDDYVLVDLVEKEIEVPRLPEGMIPHNPKTFKTQTNIEEADVHIIGVYTTDQVYEVIDKIPLGNKPLISVESTILPSKVEELRTYAIDKGVDLVLFPHRFNPNDDEHRCFNLTRVMGGATETALVRGYHFWNSYMEEDIILVPFKIAGLCKVAENAYRFMEIAIAQEIKQECDKAGFDFDDLHAAMNTKWNIDIKEARDGIGGKCLPKDAQLLADVLKDSFILRQAIKSNKVYKEKYGGDKQ